MPNAAIATPIDTATIAIRALATVRPTSYRIWVPTTLKPIIATKCMLQMAVPPIEIDARISHQIRSPRPRAARSRTAQVSPSIEPRTDNT